MTPANPRIIMVSNRLPVRLVEGDTGWTVRDSPGGLVRALGAFMRRRGDLWVGWAGVHGKVDLHGALARADLDLGYDIRAVPVSKEEYRNFYKGFANEVVWPLFHDLHTFCNFDPRYWDAYRRINHRFAEHVAMEAQPQDLVWVHDYHLMTVAEELREMGVRARLGFFLHIPFPCTDLFRRLPWREEVLRGLLSYDMLGFQTRRDLENFARTVAALRPDATLHRNGDRYEILVGERALTAGTFPIGINLDEIVDVAASSETQERVAALRRQYDGQQVIVGVDRLDYTKGIPHRLQAFRRVLEEHPELHGKLVLIQHVAPSRENVSRYSSLKRQIERMVGEINGEFGTFAWTPVQYLYSTLTFTDLVALYRFASIALVTPLKDGMNLVCMEYCAAQDDDPGVLVLSEFAGAAEGARGGALIVNPHDVQEVAEAIVRAAVMPLPERRRRNGVMMNVIDAQDVFGWVESFLEAGGFRSTPPEALPPAVERLASTQH